MKPTIKLNTQLDEHPTFINVEGEIDTSTAKELRHQLLKVLEDDTSLLLVRLKHVPYMDSSGIAVLLEVIKKARQGNARFAVLEPSPAARRAMDIVDLDALVKVYDTVEACSECTKLAKHTIQSYIFSDTELATLGSDEDKGAA